jgi:SAM-dependent methyltransferase
LADHPLEDLVGRLERERLEADRLYNDALTAIDRAIQTAPELPVPPQPPDHGRVGAINQAWDILPGGPPPVDRSVKGRLRGFIWRLLGPPLEAQRRFNAEVVDHVNRNVAANREAHEATVRLLAVVRREFAALARFESLLVQYLQTITLYVDSKDRSLAGPELRDRLALAEQRILGLKREIENWSGGSPKRVADAPAANGAAGSSGAFRTAAAFGATLDSPTYVGFEERFRGSRDDIRDRLKDYVPLFASLSDVVDIGCGRGELLDLLQQQGVTVRGVDSNEAMVQLCRERGLDVERSDALAFLERQADSSLGGLIAIQVVEHFEPAYLVRFLETAHHTLRTNGLLVLETINPACWMAFFECFIRDITHRWPLHPDTLRYLVQSSGFKSVDVQFREPVRDTDRLARVISAAPVSSTPEMAGLISVVNAHADTLNARLFSSMDYAVIARK